MADRIDDLVDRVQAVETNVDKVAAMVGQLSGSVDQRFDAVDHRLASVDQRLASVDQRLASVDQRFENVDRRFDAVDDAIVEQRQYTEFAYDRLERSMTTGFAEIKAEVEGVKTEVKAVTTGLGRLERKLDQFIDRQMPPSDETQ